MERRRAGGIRERRRVTRQAHKIHVAHLKKMNVGRSMGRVAGFAAFDLHGLMLKHERSSLVRVTSKTNRILRGRGADLFCRNSSVRVVTVTALDQSFVHPVMKWHLELGLLIEVAGIAKRRLSFDEQKFLGLRMVRRMAGDAADVVFRMHGVNRIHVLRAARMAGHATVIDFFW